MEIDPVVRLAEELRYTECALHGAVRLYERDHCQKNGEMVSTLLISLKSLHRAFLQTIPTSALGASELLRMAAQRLPDTQAATVRHFQEIADRLAAGRREHPDLVWLRAMRTALARGLCGDPGTKAAALLRLAILGAARPVIVFRAFAEPEEDDVSVLH